ncbi:hypothetical protein [Sphingosinithalassobacter sp. LHW66-3]|uniref:hypothetical protein n=1 Tax=Sphingosinithalassobacter sp. LHW66-3 TaxID=3424718 RepID=UPI003D6B6004
MAIIIIIGMTAGAAEGAAIGVSRALTGSIPPGVGAGADMAAGRAGCSTARNCGCCC